MNGVQEYNKKYLDRIKCVLRSQPDYINGFVNYLHKATVTTKTAYMYDVINFMKHVDKPVHEIGFDDFSAYLSFIEYREDGEQTTPSYRIAVYSALKKFSRYLYTTKRIKEDYMLYIERPKFFEHQKTIEKRRDGYLSKKEVAQYIKAVKGNSVNEHRQVAYRWNIRDQAIIQVFLLTGIRCSALRKLDLSNIDFKRKTLTVTDKGNKVKTYMLSDSLIHILSEWIKIREEEIQDHDAALFISNRRKRMHQDSIANVVKKYSRTIKGKHITPHKLRATYGTQLYNATGDIYFVQDCMGHSSPKTTEIYIREKKENLKKASDIMARLVEE